MTKKDSGWRILIGMRYNLHIERNTNNFDIIEVNMKLAMVSLCLLLTILCTIFTPGEAINGMRKYKRDWQQNTRELLKKFMLGDTLNEKPSDEISRDLSPPSNDEWIQLFDPSTCSVCMSAGFKFLIGF